MAEGDASRDLPVGELMRNLAQQTGTLVRQELELARAEITQKGRKAGVGIAGLGGAGILGLYALAALTACVIAALALRLPVWAAALIVAAVYAATAGVLALLGRRQLAEVSPPEARADHRDGEGGRGMGEDPDVIREQIEETRARMGDTVDALAYKADVKARMKDSVSEKKDAVVGAVTGAVGSAREAIAGTTETVGSRVAESTPDAQDVKRTAKRAAGLAQENPLGLAIGAAAVGFLIGLMIPSTPVEDERLGGLADQVKAKVQETGQEALDRGKQVVQEAAESAVSTAKESGQQHAEELAATAGDAARQVAEAGKPARGS